MKPASKVLFAATMVALGSIYGCGGGDDTSIDIDVAGGGSTGGSGTISTGCPTWASARPVDNSGNDVCQLPAEILVDRTLTSDIIWFMESRVTVGNGNKLMSLTEGTLDNGDPVLDVTLTVEPGTWIVGNTGSFANLIITRGSQIIADGTAAEPIVFSSDDAGESGSGEWGGLILHGYASHNECTAASMGVDPCNIDSEGESGFAGGYTDTDSSGVLRYVVVTEGGFEFSTGNEINGISMIGVGSGTTLEYIQVNSNSDDGVEFYGGTVSGKYFVLTGNLDDSVDWDEGWQGNLQHVLVIQDPATAGNAIEADTEGTLDFLSKPTIANATFIGDGTNDELWVFKASSAGFLLNSIGTVAAGNATITTCVDVNGGGAEANIGVALVFNNVIADCASFGKDATDDTLGATGVIAAAPGINANYQATDVAANGVAIDVPTFNATYAESTADDAFLDDTDYLGAVDPDAMAPFWYEGWTVSGSL